MQQIQPADSKRKSFTPLANIFLLMEKDSDELGDRLPGLIVVFEDRIFASRGDLA
jgi:hypothetical protein